MELFRNKKDCCGCSACMNICPKQAITMINDEYGFMYPSVNDSLCINCELCKKVCSYQDEMSVSKAKSFEAYAAAAKDENILMTSASGGVFKSLASKIINNGGVVFGCAYQMENGKLTPKHIEARTEEELKKLQGSKYVQSIIGNSYKAAEEYLKMGITVLFTGTPCQIDGLYHFLRGKKYDNLYTIDLICHGVPGVEIFQKYVESMQKKLGGTITNVCFRDKTEGWGLTGSIFYETNSGKKKKKTMPLQGFSYYKMFLDADIYRDNCYSCKYANLNRPGDLTIGDYWGIEKQHPQYLTSNGGKMDEKKGISCILVNSEAGKDLISKYSTDMDLEISQVEKVSEQNHQLNHPSQLSTRREAELDAFKNEGYTGLEKLYYRRFGLKGIIYKIWNYVPGKNI